MQSPIKWEIHNRITGETRSYKSGAAASRASDRIDNAYGACITTRRVPSTRRNSCMEQLIAFLVIMLPILACGAFADASALKTLIS